jgi:pterin-4a-carbinolamine dehydratase
MTLPYVGRNQGQYPETYRPFYLAEWEIVTRNEHCELQRTFELEDNITARRFAAQVMQVSSDYGRFPSLHIYKQWVCVIWSAHNATGLNSSDFIMAQLSDELFQQYISLVAKLNYSESTT